MCAVPLAHVFSQALTIYQQHFLTMLIECCRTSSVQCTFKQAAPVMSLEVVCVVLRTAYINSILS